MKYFLQILLLLLTWFTNTVNATPLIIKVVLPSYELTFSQTKNVKEESVTKIGFQNFVRSGISEKSQPLNATLRENYVLEESRARMSREVVSGAGRFIANSGIELKTYLDDLVILPNGKPYSGKIYRYKNTGASYNVTDINPNMNPLENRFKTGLYASTSSDGNYLEAMGNGGITGKTQYEVTNVQINNLLDLTDDNIIQQLGTSFDQMKFSNPNKIVAYEFTHVVADWAKSKGYSGIKFYGAHGSEAVYENVLIFEQTSVNNSIVNRSIIELEW